MMDIAAAVLSTLVGIALVLYAHFSTNRQIAIVEQHEREREARKLQDSAE